MRVFLPLVILLALCAALALGLKRERDSEPASPMVGKPFPALTLRGEALDVAAHGEVTFVNFFASWCMPCALEQSSLKKLAKENVVPMIGIAWKNKPEDAQTWLTSYGNPYGRLFNDENGDATVPLGLTGVPETFIVDKKGVIAYHTKQPLSKEILREEIMPLIERLKKE